MICAGILFCPALTNIWYYIDRTVRRSDYDSRGGGGKGGTGKSTLAVHLAGWSARTGRDVLLVDADRQGTAIIRMEARADIGREAPSVVRQYGRGLRRNVRDLSGRYDEVVVDMGSGDTQGIEALMRVAHLIVVPVQPNGWDVWTVELLDDLAADALEVNEELRVKVVLNRASPHDSSLDVPAAQDVLKQFECVEDSGLVVRERAAIRRATPHGMLVDEYVPPDESAARELDEVYRLVYGLLPAGSVELQEAV